MSDGDIELPHGPLNFVSANQLAEARDALEESRQLNARYRRALERIAHSTERQWCRDYAMCDHIGCKASHEHTKIALAALDVESSW